MTNGQSKALRALVERHGRAKVAHDLGVSEDTILRWLSRLTEPSPLAQEKIDAYLGREATK